MSDLEIKEINSEFIKSIRVETLSDMIVSVRTDIVDDIVDEYNIIGFSMAYTNYSGRSSVDIDDIDIEPIINCETLIIGSESLLFEFDVDEEILDQDEYLVMSKNDYDLITKQYCEINNNLELLNSRIAKLNWFQKLLFF